MWVTAHTRGCEHWTSCWDRGLPMPSQAEGRGGWGDRSLRRDSAAATIDHKNNNQHVVGVRDRGLVADANVPRVGGSEAYSRRRDKQRRWGRRTRRSRLHRRTPPRPLLTATRMTMMLVTANKKIAVAANVCL